MIGINRLKRFHRAEKLGLQPPQEIKMLLQLPHANQKCYFDQFTLRDQTKAN